MTSDDPSFYKEVLEHISDGVYFLDRDRRIRYWNKGAFRLTGYKAEELLGKYCPDYYICDADDHRGHRLRLCEDGCPLAASVDDKGPHEVRWFLQHKQGGHLPVVLHAQAIWAANGSIVGTVVIFRDDSVHQEARHKIEEMERLAFLDQVTQLPNRRYLEMSMRTALEEFHVHHDPFGLLVIDLDRFKAVNDDFGHAIGDQALLEAGKTLTAALRATDIVGRWGGDEFTAIVHHANPQMLRELAERCCVTMSKTLVPSSDDAAAFMSVSVGGTLALSGDTSNGLFKRADALMYQSKTNGRGRALVDQSYEIAEMSLRRAARA